MDEGRRSSLTIMAVGLLAVGGYLLFKQYMAPETPETPATQQGQDASGPGHAGLSPEGVSPADWQAREEIATITTDRFIAEVSTLSGGLKSMRLLGDRFKEEGEPKDLVTTSQYQYHPLRAEIGGVDMPADATWQAEQVDERTVRLSWEGNGFRVVRKLEAGTGPYQIWSTLRVDNLDESPHPVRLNYTAHHYVAKEAEEGGGFIASRSPDLSGALCAIDSDDELSVDRKTGDELTDEAFGVNPGVAIGGVENVYFGSFFATQPESRAEHCHLTASYRGGTVDDPEGTLFGSKVSYPRVELAGGSSHLTRTMMYVGPKFNDHLRAAGHGMDNVVDLGFFSFIGGGLVTLLRWLHGFLGNWGFAIIALTFGVKALLYPLNERSFRSMGRMRKLKPQMDEINERYGDDREAKGAAMMALYKKHKVNPVGGCLPMLLQLPVWWALYTSLASNVELYHQPFMLHWQDLSAPDSLYVLPVFLGGLMFVQQKLSPTTVDATQAKMMMYGMPIMMAVFMLFLPAGLCLYMVTNSILGIAQQQYIYSKLDREDPSDDGDSEPEPAPSSEKPKPAAAKKRGKRRRRGRA